MDERTKWAYKYWHDGGIYIGCRAQGENMDCYAYKIHEVDCTKCEHSKKGDKAYEYTRARRRA